MNALQTPKYAGIAWLIVRLWLGYEWLVSGIEKVFGEGNAVWVGDKAGTAVSGFLKGAIAKSSLAPGFDPVQTPHPAVQDWYAILARDYFLPNATLLSYLVAYGEVLVGLGLILGIFTHFSALMGVLMNLAYLFAGTTSTNPQLLVVGLTIVLVGGVAVGYYGLDYFARPLERRLTNRTLRRFAPVAQPQ
jgi:thiosulfate dehydrogenase [quinone] large subunit